MAGGRVYNGGSGGGGSSPLSVLFQNQKGSCASQPLDSLFLSGSSPSFLGTLSFFLLAISLSFYIYTIRCSYGWFRIH